MTVDGGHATIATPADVASAGGQGSALDGTNATRPGRLPETV